jgi:heme/copper-type cytochrome/quinol oxidase subunit 2
MAIWKVLIIALLSCVCAGLTMATVAIPIAQTGQMFWVWLSGLFLATVVAGVLLTFFLRYAGESLDVKPRTGTR